LPAGTVRFDRVQEAEELLVPMALHAAAEHRAVEHVEGGEQRRGAVALVVEGHGARLALLHGQARLGSIQSLNLALLVDREHHGMGRRIDVQPDHVPELGGELGVFGDRPRPRQVRVPGAWHRRPWQDAHHRALRRGKVLEFFANLPACLVGVEACPSAPLGVRDQQAWS
jgi:hypothetical protein